MLVFSARLPAVFASRDIRRKCLQLHDISSRGCR